MKITHFLSLFGLILLSSCSSWNVSDVTTHKNTKITSSYAEDSKIKNVIAPYKDSLDHSMNTVISYTSVDLNKNGQNSNLGNLMADFLLNGANDWAQNANHPTIDAAIINIGGIRSTIGVGKIYLKNIYEVMPFENEVVVVKMKGKDIKAIFDYYVTKQKNNPVSNMYIETDETKLIKGLINGQKIDPEADYFIATSDYLANGGDDMKFFGLGKITNTGIKFRDVLIKEFKDHPEITPPNDVRLILSK